MLVEIMVIELETIMIEWAESNVRDWPQTYTTWGAFEDVMVEIYNDRMKAGESAHGGYTKVKVHIEWADGRIMIDRVDVGSGAGDWGPPEKVGRYMAQQNSAMYESSFQYEKDENTGEITDRERELYSWGTNQNKAPKEVSDDDRRRSTKKKMEVFIQSIENACKEYLRS